MDKLKDMTMELIAKNAKNENATVPTEYLVAVALELERLERIRAALLFGTGDS